MRKTIFNICLATIALLATTSCEEEYVYYEGPDYIMFSDTLYTLPIQNNEDYFDIPVSATQACDYDRTLAVEIIDAESNAIEGRHYTIESNTITIKAGERATNVRVKGIYDNIGIADSLGFTLRLISEEKTHWELYGIDANVVLKKACPFDINMFTGYCTVTSTYMYSYMNVTKRLITSEIDTTAENTIILKDFLYDGYDIKVKFTTDDPLNPLIEMEEQVVAHTAEVFYHILGDGNILMYQPSFYLSYYSPCEQFIYQYMTVYIADVGTLGTYINVLKWISDDEAAKLKREGY